MGAPMRTVEVYADIWCPFAHVGLRRFVEARDAKGAGAALLVRAWPLELINHEPLDPHHVAAEIDVLRDTVAPDLFTGFDVHSFPSTTLPALRLTAAATAESLERGEAVALELRNRLFEQGEDVADPAVLAEVAEAHGVTGTAGDDAVEAEWAQACERGTEGSPHFFTDTGGFFCPAFDISKDGDRLRVAADPEGFDAFLQSCFGSE
jgi:predicted DsbA family dithiol-disulfide isomerase